MSLRALRLFAKKNVTKERQKEKKLTLNELIKTVEMQIEKWKICEEITLFL